MHWKFYELLKFKDGDNSKNLTKNSELKYQWLEFFNERNKQLEELNRNELNKKWYEITKMSLWDDDQHIVYWKQQMNKRDIIEHQKIENLKAFKEGEIKDGLEGEMSKVKFGLKNNLSEEDILEDIKFLNKKKTSWY